MNPTRLPPDPELPNAAGEGGRALIHPLAAVVLVVVDSLWTLADWAAVLWLVTIPLSFVAVAFPTLLVQKLLNRDSLPRALAVATFLGVLAAVPTPVMGTAAGAFVLALAGWRRFQR